MKQMYYTSTESLDSITELLNLTNLILGDSNTKTDFHIQFNNLNLRLLLPPLAPFPLIDLVKKIYDYFDRDKIRQEKEILYKDIIKKQNRTIHELNRRINSLNKDREEDKKRIQDLNKLIKMQNEVIRRLKYDLGY